MAPAISSEAADGLTARHREETSLGLAVNEPLSLHIGEGLRRTNGRPFKLFASEFRPSTVIQPFRKQAGLMKYRDGQDIKLGDRVALGSDRQGVVVCLLDSGEYSTGCPAEEWNYLKHRVIIEFPTYGKIHYGDVVEPDVELIARI